MSVFTGNRKLKPGFWLMRLPKNEDGPIDIEQTAEMTDLFMEAGGMYFDTAFARAVSEEAARRALVERYPPRSVYPSQQADHFTGIRKHGGRGRARACDRP